jgi:hypothetical protein
MDRQPQETQDAAERDSSTQCGSGEDPRRSHETQERPSLKIGPLLVQTIRHFFPDFNDWLDEFPDRRDPERTEYDKRFLIGCALMLFVCKLGSRRACDFHFREADSAVLNNLNRLFGTEQTSCPVNQTIDNYLATIGVPPLGRFRRSLIYTLLRGRVLDSARLLGKYVVLIDGTGYLTFRQPHCQHCLTKRCGETTLYQHQVLEAKLLGPDGMVLSLGSEFIDNRDQADSAADASDEQRKQDCELKALRRLAKQLRADFPQLPICLSNDSLSGCGEGFQIAKDYKLSFIYVFKEGRTPALWRDFQDLLKLCPKPVEEETAEKTHQVYRWVNDLDYTDSDKREWKLNAIHCAERRANGKESQWAWLTCLPVNAANVVEVATLGGRVRWCEENQGFNVQKNSGLNMEHAYSKGEHFGVYYYLLQIAHIVLQLLEKGSLLRRLAREQGKHSAVAFFGGLKYMAVRLLESLRNWCWPRSASIPNRESRSASTLPSHARTAQQHHGQKEESPAIFTSSLLAPTTLPHALDSSPPSFADFVFSHTLLTCHPWCETSLLVER